MKLRVFTMAGLLSLSVAASSVAAPLAAPATGIVSLESATTARAPAGVVAGSRSEERRYAAREAANPEAKDYRGGDVIVISASALAVILLVILVIVLI